MPPKKVTTTTTTKRDTKSTATKPQATTQAQVPVVDKVQKPPVKHVKMKEAIPNEMKKLQDLKRWPIIMDDVGE